LLPRWHLAGTGTAAEISFAIRVLAALLTLYALSARVLLITQTGLALLALLSLNEHLAATTWLSPGPTSRALAHTWRWGNRTLLARVNLRWRSRATRQSGRGTQHQYLGLNVL